MGGGGKGGSTINEGHAREAYTNFNQYAMQSPTSDINQWGGYTSWAAANPSLAPYAQAGWDAAMQQRRMREMMSGFSERMAEFAAGPEMPEGPTPEELEQQRLEREREEGTAKRDTLYGEYLDAANTAADYIDQQIAREKANAQLLGIEYQLTPEQRSERINNYFASIWDESKQTELEGLFEKWGNPEGFEDWRVVRGETPTQADRPEDTIESSTGAPKPGAGAGTPAPALTSVLGSPDEENLLGSSTLLGG